MRSTLSAALALLSLLLCIASATLWVRGYWLSDWVQWQTPAVVATLTSARGKIQLQCSWGPRSGSGPWAIHRRTSPASAPPDFLRMRGGGLVDRRFAGFTLQSGELLGRFIFLTAPHWAICFTSAPLAPCLFLHHRRQRSRQRLLAGLCPTCAYDLRATPSRCPECGTPIRPEPQPVEPRTS